MNIRTKLNRAKTRFQNWRRAKRDISPYVGLTLSSEIAEFPRPVSLPDIPFIEKIVGWLPLPSGPDSVSGLRRTFEQLALDSRIKGVRLKINCAASGSVYQSLRGVLMDFRRANKRVVAYAESFGPFQYYLACACDQIVMPPSAEWGVAGFANDYIFFKDALDQLGIGIDLIRVSPFKSAGDQFTQTDFSADSRAQAEWLLDARFNTLVSHISQTRNLSETRVRELIDSAPMSATDALKHGLIDAVLYEDELENYLAPEHAKRTPKPLPKWFIRLPNAIQNKLRDAVVEEPITALSSWGDVQDDVLVPIFDYTDKSVGIVRIEGSIMRGNSVESPLPLPIFEDGTAGSNTVAQAIRRAENDKKIASVVLFVDSPGGDSLASDLMAREIKRLASKKPVVVYMGGVAASGGYYVAAFAQHIVAQPLTITGSIGVFLIKPNTQNAFNNIFLHRTVLKRGQNSGVYSNATPFNDREREVMQRTVLRIYDEFKQVVSDGRKIAFENLEPICGGRVWTGEQAQTHHLVDELGDFRAATNKARELGGISSDKKLRTVFVYPPRDYVLPKPFAAAALAELGDLFAQYTTALKQVRAWAWLPWGSLKSD